MSKTTSATIVDFELLRRSCANCALQELCLPAAIDGSDLTKLDDIVRAKRPLDTGEPLFREAASFGSIYVLRSGSLKSTVLTNDGQSQVLGFHLPGEIIGFDALSDGVHRCSAIALERSSVCEVPFTRLEEVAAQIPGLQRQLHKIISRELVAGHDHLVTMGKRQAQERLASFLLSLSDRFAALHKANDAFTLSMSRQDIASYLGLVVETVSRLFSRFEEQGALKVNRREIQITSRDKLLELCGDALPKSLDSKARA